MADHRGIRRRNSAAGEFDGENTKERLEATIATIKNLRKVRVICSDPDATDDSSSDEADDHDRSSTRRIVCEIVLPVTSDEAVEQKGKGKGEGEGEGGSGKARGKKKCPGVRMRKWGRWAAEIRDPFSRKRLWLGSFNTEEEASIAYLAKKEEFRARLEKEGPNVQPLSEGGSSSKTPTGGSQEVDNSADGKEKETHSSGRVDSREELTRAQCKGSQFAQMSKLGESCAKPFKKRKNWLGTSDASEEKSNAFLFKKLDCGKGCTGRPGSEIGSYLKSPKAETLSLFSDAGGEAVSGTTTASMEVSGEEGEGQVGPDGKGEEKKQSWLGLGLGTLAIDNNGNLLGEFSKLDDDLKIC